MVLRVGVLLVALVITVLLATSLETSRVSVALLHHLSAANAGADAQPVVPSAPLEETEILTSVERETGTVQKVRSGTYSDRQRVLREFLSSPATATDAEVLVAVLDTGIDENHKELAGKVVASVNFSRSQVTTDLNGHGTHVAGIIVATANSCANGSGPHIRLMNVKVAEDDGAVWPSTVVKGIIWAVDNGADIINLSLYVPSDLPALKEAVGYAWSRGVLVVAGAGNGIKGVPVYPACYPEVIAVAAADAEGRLWERSNYGDWVDVCAPGVGILSTLPGNSYGHMSGTSMATAYVSAVASLTFTRTTDSDGDGFLHDDVAELLETLLSPEAESIATLVIRSAVVYFSTFVASGACLNCEEVFWHP